MNVWNYIVGTIDAALTRRKTDMRLCGCMAMHEAGRGPAYILWPKQAHFQGVSKAYTTWCMS